MKKITNLDSKRGAASLYVVIFTTILMGIITLSFVRIMLSEASQTTNYDLNQSAYDAALAGIEDAKIALLNYHDCLSKGYSSAVNLNLSDGVVKCDEIIYYMNYFTTPSIYGTEKGCNSVAAILGRNGANYDYKNQNGSEVLVVESGGITSDENEMQQAYTCVKMTEELSDYRSYLNASNPVRIVPIRSSEMDSVKNIRISWYSQENYSTDKAASKQFNWLNNSFDPTKFADFRTTVATPPVLSAALIQAPKSGFSLADFDTNAGSNTNYGLIWLSPSGGQGGSTVSANDIALSNDNHENKPISIKCNNTSTADFFCQATLSLPKTRGGESASTGNTFLVLSLPYNNANAVDFSIELLKNGSSTPASFTGVQASVDSTGRANDLYRRLEARIELVDTYFPYPEYAVQLNGEGYDSVLEKNFWVTNHCWYSDGGSASTCRNSRTVGGFDWD